jgi:hypothetical protein
MVVAISRCRDAIGGARERPLVLLWGHCASEQGIHPCLCFCLSQRAVLSHSPSKANDLTSYKRAIHMLGA